jgi:hypothetical protein
VPRAGQQHVQVGRADEVKALLKDIERIADGGSGVRFVIGDYGSGKTFFLHLIRSMALQQKLVTVHADLSPDRRLHATGGQARSLYAELMRNMSTRAKPDGGAMANVLERFITEALTESKTSGVPVDEVIRSGLSQLTELTGGYDFAEVVAKYWEGYDTGNEQLKSDAVRWLRGEFTTKTDARNALGVRTIIDDANFYDQLKLLALFVRLAGFGGLLICLDEMVNLYKLANSQARNSNYEQILRIINDATQGTATGLGFIMGGTPDFLMDTRRGLYSYTALQTRLAENSYAVQGLVDYSGPVIRLPGLTPEDLYVLLTKLRHVYASGDAQKHLMPDEGIEAYMAHCQSRIGDSYFRTPRNSIKGYLDLLAVLEQNPDHQWSDLVARIEIKVETNPDLEPVEPTVDAEGWARSSSESPSSPSDSSAQFSKAPIFSQSPSSDDDLTSFQL